MLQQKDVSVKVDLSEYRDTGRGSYQHIINLATPGYLQLPVEIRSAIQREFMLTKRGDHHYTIFIKDFDRVYICENGQGYTAMLPSEY